MLSTKDIIEQITSFFENGTTKIQYSYVANLRDGRGYTCGRCGFTTGTSDASYVVQKYEQLNPSNQLSRFIPELKTLDNAPDSEKGNISGLVGFKEAWKAECKNPLFLKVQDDVNDEVYYNPAVKYHTDLEFKLPLSLSILYDTIIQHGDGTDEDSIGSLITRTPASIKDEVNWMQTFLAVREKDLKNPYNKDTQKVWKDSVTRVHILRRLVKKGNFNLTLPIKMTYDGTKVTIK